MPDIVDMQFWGKAYAWTMKQTRDRSLAEDVASTACIRMVTAQRRAQRGEVVISDWEDYGYRIIRNLVLDHYRSKRRAWLEAWPEVSGDDAGDDLRTLGIAAQLPCQPDPFDEVAERDFWRRLLGRVQFTEEQAEVFQMRFVEQMGFEEIGRRMGKNANSVKSIRNRAVWKLQEAAA